MFMPVLTPGTNTTGKKILMKRIAFLLCFFLGYKHGFAGKTDTLLLWSNAMHKTVPSVVIVPDAYANTPDRYPVLYLLHGAGGDYKNWLAIDTGLARYADQYHIIIVCPDGGNTSWYFDSPIDSSMRYETFISKELTRAVDSSYRTVASREKRAITGLSMGGHGALYLAIRHPDIWSAAGSMSGGVDIRPFPKNWDIAKRLGTIDSNPAAWESNTVTNMLPQLKAAGIAVIFDCGYDDFFLKVNRELHDKMQALKIPHDYTERPGGHNRAYWKNALPYQLLYFSGIFNRTENLR